MLWSPPTQGCSGEDVAAFGKVFVVPAGTGVFRPGGDRGSRIPGDPRRRGGVPRKTVSAGRRSSWSPPKRGCSEPARRRRHPLEVVPADAGVIRLRPGPRKAGSRGSRRRGGVPIAKAQRDVADAWFPQTRGCSVVEELLVPQVEVIPADAGVFRHGVLGHRWAGRGSRRRGGDPRPLSTSA